MDMRNGPHFMIVFSRAEEGREAAFRSWYEAEHILDQLGVPGYTSGQFLELSAGVPGQEDEYQFCAVYEIADDQLEEARSASAAAIARWREEGRITPDLKRPAKILWYTAVTAKVEAAQT